MNKLTFYIMDIFITIEAYKLWTIYIYWPALVKIDLVNITHEWTLTFALLNWRWMTKSHHNWKVR